MSATFYQELHEALEPLTAPTGRDKLSVKLADTIMASDYTGVHYSTENSDPYDNLSADEELAMMSGRYILPVTQGIPLQLPVSLVLHIAALRCQDPTRFLPPAEDLDPLVSQAVTVIESLGQSEATLPYELLLLEKLSKKRSSHKPQLFSLDKEVDWSVVVESLDQELSTLNQVLKSPNIALSLGRLVGGNLPLDQGQALVPGLCERGLVVAATEGEDARATLARAIYLLGHYNKERQRLEAKPLFSVGIYEAQEDGGRSLTVFELPKALPVESVMSLCFGA